MRLQHEGRVAAQHPALLLQPVLKNDQVWEERRLGRVDIGNAGAAIALCPWEA